MRPTHIPPSAGDLTGKVAANLAGFMSMARVYYRADRQAFYLDFRDHAGKRCNRRGGRTLEEAEAKLTAIVSQLTLVRAGLVSRQQYELARWAQAPIEDIRDEYLASVRARMKTPAYIKEAERMINAWIIGAEVQCLDDVDAAKTESWLADNPGWSYRTRNAYLKAAVGFLNWCDKRNRIAKNPLRQVEAFNEALDPRQPSRAMTPVELRALLATTPMPRRAYYALGGRAGLRWGEIARLTWAQVDLEQGLLTLAAATTKNQKASTLPIADDLQALLRELGPGKPSARLFPQSPTLRTWCKDLLRAGVVQLAKGKKAWSKVEDLIGYADEYGQLDRKCLRKTFNTHLAAAGVDAQRRQRLMRHSDMRLTTNVYVDPRLLDLRGAVNQTSQPSTNAPNITPK